MKMKNIQRFSLVLLLISCSLLPASAQKQVPPEGGPSKAFSLPPHDEYTLPNGMKVTLIPYGIIPKAAVSIAIDAGSLNEGNNWVGVANLTAEFLKQGTSTLAAQQVAEKAASMGSTLEIAAGADQTTLDLDVLHGSAQDAVHLIADILQHPRLPESELARLKNNQLRQISVRKARPQTIALMRFRKILYGDHPYSVVLPTEADINKITLQDVKGFMAANFGAQRAHIYVAGKFDKEAVKKAIAENLGGWAGSGTPKIENVPSPKFEKVLDVTDRSGAPQSTIIVGLPVASPISPDTIPLTVTNALLGGSFNSRITANIREQKGYTYSPRSEVSRRYHDAYWDESADVTTKFTGDSLKEIFAEIARLQKEPPTEIELKGIQSYLAGLFVIQNSSRAALISQLQYADLQGLGEDYLKTYVAKVNAVTPADVQKMTARYIKTEQMTIVVVGDKATISNQLTPFQTGN
jgi:zinc protease